MNDQHHFKRLSKIFSERMSLRKRDSSTIGLVNDDRVVPGGISESIYKSHLKKDKVPTPPRREIPKIPERIPSPESYHVSENSQRRKLNYPSPRRYGKIKKHFGLNHYYSEESDDQFDSKLDSVRAIKRTLQNRNNH